MIQKPWFVEKLCKFRVKIQRKKLKVMRFCQLFISFINQLLYKWYKRQLFSKILKWKLINMSVSNKVSVPSLIISYQVMFLSFRTNFMHYIFKTECYKGSFLGKRLEEFEKFNELWGAFTQFPKHKYYYNDLSAGIAKYFFN